MKLCYTWWCTCSSGLQSRSLHPMLLSNGNLIEQGNLEGVRVVGVMKAAANTRIPTSESRIGANLSHQCLSSSVSSLASTYVCFITNEYVHPLF
ncbi:hypothetical protein Hanom_Chr09g00770041 [Helianthus anomalus]